MHDDAHDEEETPVGLELGGACREKLQEGLKPVNGPHDRLMKPGEEISMVLPSRGDDRSRDREKNHDCLDCDDCVGSSDVKLTAVSVAIPEVLDAHESESDQS